MKAKYVVAVLLTVSLFLYFLHLPLLRAADTSGQRTWGTGLTVNQSILVNEHTEIAKGHWCYIIKAQAGEAQVPWEKWEGMLAGDMSQFKTDIESDIPGAEATWLSISWSKAEKKTGTAYDSNGNPITIVYYVVSGMIIEAIVKNVNAGMTGAEIAVILLAIAVLAFIIAVLVWGTMVIKEILDAARQLGPAVTIGVGLILFVILIAAVLMVLGVGFAYTGKGKSGRRVSVGRNSQNYFSLEPIAHEQ